MADWKCSPTPPAIGGLTLRRTCRVGSKSAVTNSSGVATATFAKGTAAGRHVTTATGTISGRAR